MSKRETSMYWLWGNDEPICPYCEHLEDPYELRLRGDGDTDQIQCPNCNKFFNITLRVSYKFDTKGDCKKNNQMPHKLYRPKGDPYAWTCQGCFEEFYDWALPGGKYEKLKPGEFVLIESKEELL